MKTSHLFFIILALAVGGTSVYYATRPPQPAPPVQPAAETPPPARPLAEPLPVEPAPVEAEPPIAHIPQPAATDTNSLSVCSFNVQFLGNFKDKDDESLALNEANFSR